jgi:hypothetical protein
VPAAVALDKPETFPEYPESEYCEPAVFVRNVAAEDRAWQMLLATSSSSNPF